MGCKVCLGWFSICIFGPLSLNKGFHNEAYAWNCKSFFSHAKRKCVHPCPSLVFVAVINTTSRSNWGCKGYISFFSFSIITGGSQGRSLEQKSWRNTPSCLVPSGLLSHMFLYSPAQWVGMAVPVVSWTLLHKQATKKCLTNTVTGQPERGTSLVEASSSQEEQADNQD